MSIHDETPPPKDDAAEPKPPEYEPSERVPSEHEPSGNEPSERERLEREALPDTRMSLGDHIEELRHCLLRAILGLVVATGICLLAGDRIIGFIAQPMLLVLQLTGHQPELYVSSLPEAFMTYLKVGLVSGVFLASPWIFRQLWNFVSVGLYAHERRFVHIFVPLSTVLFVLGGVFFIFIIAPCSFNFFIMFGQRFQTPNINNVNPITRVIVRAIIKNSPVTVGNESGPATPEGTTTQETARTTAQTNKPYIRPLFTLQKYVSFVTLMGLAFGVAFQTPLAVFFLGRLGLISLHTLQTTRKYAVFIISIISALMTPADVFSMIAMAIPMYLLYELGIVLLRVWPRRV